MAPSLNIILKIIGHRIERVYIASTIKGSLMKGVGDIHVYITAIQNVGNSSR